jgi:hypothetical protein
MQKIVSQPAIELIFQKINQGRMDRQVEHSILSKVASDFRPELIILGHLSLSCPVPSALLGPAVLREDSSSHVQANFSKNDLQARKIFAPYTKLVALGPIEKPFKVCYQLTGFVPAQEYCQSQFTPP